LENWVLPVLPNGYSGLTEQVPNAASRLPPIPLEMCMFADIRAQAEQAFCSEVLAHSSRNRVLRVKQPLLENWTLLVLPNRYSGLTEQVPNRVCRLPPIPLEMCMSADIRAQAEQAFCSEVLVH
jgi:hypothetical protein